MGKAISVSFAQRPLVVVRFPGVPSDDEFQQFLDILAENLRAALRKRVKTAIVLDTTGAPTPISAHQRRLQAAWLKDYYEELRAGCAGTGFAISSSLVRGAMTAVLWLQDLPYPYAICKTAAEAETWCLQQLAQANRGGSQNSWPA